jgi:Tfp pilus assembly protein PilV
MTRRSITFRNRPGFAMFMALGAMVIIGVLVAGSSFITLQETRLGQNSIVQSRAFAAAEYGLNKVQADWDRTPNLTMENATSFDTSYTVAGQGTAKVRVTRLNNETFWLVSEGRASAGNATSAQRTAVKRVGAVLRLRIPTIKANAAITAGGSVSITGTASVVGTNTNPAGWTGCPSGSDKVGIVVPTGATVTIDGSANNPQGWTTDPLAADSNTYVRYGDETWNSLVAQAVPPGGKTISSMGSQVEPDTLANGLCDKTKETNWGEPWRSGTGYKPGCITYFPIIYATGALTLNKNARGQGIMLVNGDLKLVGDFEWHGLIIVKDDIVRGAGTANVYGAVMARNEVVADENSKLSGKASYSYSNCALERAMRGSAQVLQARGRAWAELYD